jgi:hypothetical protein
MGLENLTIIPETGEPIKALFNPERYTLNKGVQIAEIAIPGLDSPVLQFVRGQNEKITLELFFDTTKHGMVDPVVDVRTETSKIYQLLKVDSETHAPPRCELFWGEGGMLFCHDESPFSLCVVESMSEEFNLFSPSGIPLRAKLNVTFREYKTIEEQLFETPRHSSTRTKVRRLRRGESLSHLAWLEYRDPGQWRLIAEANDVDNPRLVPPGTVLKIPRGAGGRKR